MRATDGEARESTPALTLVAGLSGVVLVLALVSCSGSATKAISPATLTSTSTTSAPPTTGAVTPTTVAPMTTTTVPTATLSTAGLVACNENELEAEYKGVQGAVGNWAAGFWLVDTSPHACVLQSPARLDLLNSAGGVQLSATGSFMSIALSADTSMPPDNTVPSGQLAILSMFWPNDWDAEGAVNGRCPSPDFVLRQYRSALAVAGR
jgi:hypothetical protein